MTNGRPDRSVEELWRFVDTLVEASRFQAASIEGLNLRTERQGQRLDRIDERLGQVVTGLEAQGRQIEAQGQQIAALTQAVQALIERQL